MLIQKFVDLNDPSLIAISFLLLWVLTFVKRSYMINRYMKGTQMKMANNIYNLMKKGRNHLTRSKSSIREDEEDEKTQWGKLSAKKLNSLLKISTLGPQADIEGSNATRNEPNTPTRSPLTLDVNSPSGGDNNVLDERSTAISPTLSKTPTTVMASTPIPNSSTPPTPNTSLLPMIETMLSKMEERQSKKIEELQGKIDGLEKRMT